MSGELINNIEEGYCSSGIGKNLRLLGFEPSDKSCNKRQDGELCPTYQTALDWIRINFGVWISVSLNEREYRATGRNPVRCELDDISYSYVIGAINAQLVKDWRCNSSKNFACPNYALEEAILYVLARLLQQISL